ncbi:MAG: ester cyclase [Pseudomonadota bacterium]
MSDFRHDMRRKLATLWRAEGAGRKTALAQTIHPDATFDLAWPLPACTGPEQIETEFLQPLTQAIAGLHRRDLLFFGGQNTRAAGGEWIASLTHYVGNFIAPLWGVAPSQSLVFLRAGEFFRIENGMVTEARIIFDLPDLLRQTGRFSLPSLGTEIAFPAPATQDGLCPPREGAETSLQIVQGMLGDLHEYDPETGASQGQTGTDGYWHRDMMWYGPAGIGSNFQWDGFVKDHRAPFLSAFPDRKGGNHYCRLGDGPYAAVSGWPSMTMTHQGDYLGVPATGKPLTLRVMDFYRCDGRQICENWVCLDYGDLFAQMGVNILEA